MDESWKLYNVYFELNCPFDHDDFNLALENHNDVLYDGMDFMITDNKKSNVYGYWFYVRSNVISSFEEYLQDRYEKNLITSGIPRDYANFYNGVTIDYANFIVRRSSGRTAYKSGQYRF